MRIIKTFLWLLLLCQSSALLFSSGYGHNWNDVLHFWGHRYHILICLFILTSESTDASNIPDPVPSPTTESPSSECHVTAEIHAQPHENGKLGFAVCAFDTLGILLCRNIVCNVCKYSNTKDIKAIIHFIFETLYAWSDSYLDSKVWVRMSALKKYLKSTQEVISCMNDVH